jgi:ABC-2 type transport system ATP-binding protein/sodium transport system ATP-binding protein
MLLSIQKINKAFKQKNKEIQANRDISFTVSEGEILGILGPNGAGKTTLIKQITNLLIPDSGKIFFKGGDVVKYPHILRGGCSLLLEGLRNIYPYLTGEANLLYFAYLNHITPALAKERSIKLLKQMGLYEVKNKYSFEYSSGMNRKLAVATCLINEPELVILDEPTSGLDVVAVEDLISFIKELAKDKNKTFILVSHNMRFIEKVVERVIWMRNGLIWMDKKVEEIKNTLKNKEILISVRDSPDVKTFLSKNNLPFTYIGSSIIRVVLNITIHKEFLSELLSSFEVLNIEKQDSDFEFIFKELYNETYNKS